ncbi:hypothetical protein ACSYDW_01230 [Paeniglutamicibacter sp. R2-26]|uniref:hypothetical protein n=1 Tax=Paeniglutamicibacter sp. R2-26 TaxID=3144417 RepID=UPI003EE66156
MPFTKVSDQLRLAPDFIARRRSLAIPPPDFFDLRSPYRELDARADAVWPRAGIRPMPLLQGRRWWAVQLWDAPGVKALVRHEDGLLIPTGLWLCANFATLPEAMDWAAAEVDKRRPKAYASGPWGAAC